MLYQLYETLGYEQVYLVQQNGKIYHPDSLGVDDPRDGVAVGNTMTLATPATPGPGYTKTIPAGSEWWRFDDKTDFCSRFALLFPGPLPASWTDIQNPPTSTSAPSLNEINMIKQIVQRWRNAEATFMGIYVLTSGLMWGYPIDQVWGASTGNWGGTTVFYEP